MYNHIQSKSKVCHTVNTAAEIISIKNKSSRIAQNLRSLLAEHRVSENEVAQALNIPAMTIRRLVSGETTDPRISTLKLIADHFDVPVDLLIDNNSPASFPQTGRATPRFVPVLDWQTTAEMPSVSALNLRQWQTWHPVVLNSHATLSEHAFALESRPSMHPRFPAGTLFIIDPNASPTDGDIVLVRMKNGGSPSLRELVIDIPRWQFLPLIPGSEALLYDTEIHEIMGISILTLLHTKR